MNDKNNCYQIRNSGQNVAEQRFENYCKFKGYVCQRFGFDEKSGNLQNFYDISPVIRSLPDYMIIKDGKSIFVHVKGTNKIKLMDLVNYSIFEQMLSNGIAVYYAFMFEDSMHMLTMDQLLSKCTGKKIEEFANDKHHFISLDFK